MSLKMDSSMERHELDSDEDPQTADAHQNDRESMAGGSRNDDQLQIEHDRLLAIQLQKAMDEELNEDGEQWFPDENDLQPKRQRFHTPKASGSGRLRSSKVKKKHSESDAHQKVLQDASSSGMSNNETQADTESTARESHYDNQLQIEHDRVLAIQLQKFLDEKLKLKRKKRATEK